MREVDKIEMQQESREIKAVIRMCIVLLILVLIIFIVSIVVQWHYAKVIEHMLYHAYDCCKYQ